MADPEQPLSRKERAARWRRGPAYAVLGAVLLGAVVLAAVLVGLRTNGDGPKGRLAVSSSGGTLATQASMVATEKPASTPTSLPAASPEALARDAQRLKALSLLQGALHQYLLQFRSFPDTGDNLQTLCANEATDAGCELRKVLAENAQWILVDPLGNPSANGFWYSSHAQMYTIWMLREGPANPGEPVCPDGVPRPQDKVSLFCISVWEELPHPMNPSALPDKDGA